MACPKCKKCKEPKFPSHFEASKQIQKLKETIAVQNATIDKLQANIERKNKQIISLIFSISQMKPK